MSLCYKDLTPEHKNSLRTFRMLILLLLLCLLNYSGTTTIPLSGIKGGNITLPCEFKDHEISDISLNSLSENIPVCQTEECHGRMFKEGSCDIIIKNLRLSDAGKYILLIYYKNHQAELERQILEYHLHIHDEISVKKGEELKMDVLLINADKVEHQTNTKWKEVWTRGHGVQSDRLTARDGNLIINRFTVTDTGTYRVLDSEGEILITVTVTDSMGNLETDDHKTEDKEETVANWRLAVGLTVFLVVLVVLILTGVTLLECHRLPRGYKRRSL